MMSENETETLVSWIQLYLVLYKSQNHNQSYSQKHCVHLSWKRIFLLMTVIYTKIIIHCV